MVDATPLRLATRVDGSADAPALLCCNSLGTSMGMWDAQIPAWTGHRRVIRYDAPGHGASPADPTASSLEVLGRAAVEVLDANGVDVTDVCGLSLGGLVALWLAINHPDRVRRLVLACTAARIGTATLWEDRAVAVRRDGMAAIAAPVLERFFSPGFAERDPVTVDRIATTLRGVTADGYADACLALRDADLRTELGRITAPTLVICGALDVATPPTVVRELHDGIPGARWLEIPDAGHLANLEQPTAFAAAVTGFLSGPIGDGPA